MMQLASQEQRPGGASLTHNEAGLYIYCVAPIDESVDLGPVGIEHHDVYAVVDRGLGVFVHDSTVQPYSTQDLDQGTQWILAHHAVVETAWKQWGAVIPIVFNTLVSPGETGARESLLCWLRHERETLKRKLASFEGKAEYGVQVFWDPVQVARRVSAASSEIRKLEEQANSGSRGAAYMYRQRLESALRKEVEAQASIEVKGICDQLRSTVDSIHIGKVRNAGDEEWPMLLNLSCLVSTKGYPDLKSELGRIGEREGLRVRLVGPWPPYSFC